MISILLFDVLAVEAEPRSTGHRGPQRGPLEPGVRVRINTTPYRFRRRDACVISCRSPRWLGGFPYMPQHAKPRLARLMNRTGRSSPVMDVGTNLKPSVTLSSGRRSESRASASEIVERGDKSPCSTTRGSCPRLVIWFHSSYCSGVQRLDSM